MELELTILREKFGFYINDYEQSVQEISYLIKEYEGRFGIDKELFDLKQRFEEKKHNLRVYKINYQTLFFGS